MSFTLVESAQSSESNLQRGIIKRIVETSPLTGVIPFETKPKMRHTFSIEGKLPKSGSRGLNEAFVPSSEGNKQGNLQLQQFGSSFLMDDEVLDIEGFDGQSEQTSQLKKHLRSISLNWKDKFINGDNGLNEKEFDGVKVLNQLASDAGFTVQVKFGGANHGQSLATATAAMIMDFLNEMIDLCIGVPDLFVTHRPVGRLFDRVLQIEAKNNVLAQKWKKKNIQIAEGMFKRPLMVRIGEWEDIPIFYADENAEELAVIGFNEKIGINSDGSSMYAIKFGEEFVTGLQKRASGPKVREKPNDSGILTKLDWPTAVHMGHPLSVVRGKGMRP